MNDDVPCTSHQLQGADRSISLARMILSPSFRASTSVHSPRRHRSDAGTDLVAAYLRHASLRGCVESYDAFAATMDFSASASRPASPERRQRPCRADLIVTDWQPWPIDNTLSSTGDSGRFSPDNPCLQAAGSPPAYCDRPGRGGAEACRAGAYEPAERDNETIADRACFMGHPRLRAAIRGVPSTQRRRRSSRARGRHRSEFEKHDRPLFGAIRLA